MGASLAKLHLDAARHGETPSASTMNARDLVNFARMASTSFWAAEAFQALALSTLSKAMMTKRWGGVPSSATIFSVRVTNFPPADRAADSPLGRSCLTNASRSVIWLRSMMA